VYCWIGWSDQRNVHLLVAVCVNVSSLWVAPRRSPPAAWQRPSTMVVGCDETVRPLPCQPFNWHSTHAGRPPLTSPASVSQCSVHAALRPTLADHNVLHVPPVQPFTTTLSLSTSLLNPVLLPGLPSLNGLIICPPSHPPPATSASRITRYRPDLLASLHAPESPFRRSSSFPPVSLHCDLLVSPSFCVVHRHVSSFV